MTLPAIFDDQFALSRLQQGDEHYFNLLFQRYRNRLFHYIFAITKSAVVAEETVMDVFLKLWHGREMASQINNLEDFLFKVAHNKAIDFLRMAKRNPVVQQNVWDSLQWLSSDQADEKLLKENVESAINEAMRQLSPQRQKVFYLRHAEALSYKEIAERLDLSEHTIRNHLASSFAFIRKFLGKHDIFLFVLFCVLLNFF